MVFLLLICCDIRGSVGVIFVVSGAGMGVVVVSGGGATLDGTVVLGDVDLVVVLVLGGVECGHWLPRRWLFS